MAKTKRRKPQTFSEPYVKKIRKKEREKAVEDFYTGMICIYAMALHDTFGFGKKRIEKVSMRVKELFEGLESGEISSKEVERVVKEELDLEYELR
jgi:hypothetical protein